MTAPRLTEIEAIYRREFQRWDSTALIEVDVRPQPPKPGEQASLLPSPLAAHSPASTLTTIKLDCTPEDFQAGLSYRYYGKWSVHQKYGRQFIASTFVRCQPFGRAGVIRYLSQAPGIGQATAARLWEKFGGDAVRIVRETPEVAVAAVGMSHFTDAKAGEAATYLVGESRLESCVLDLLDLLGGRGFPKQLTQWLIGDHGNRAAEVVRADPYILADKYPGGFMRADALYCDLGYDPAAIERQARCARYLIHSDNGKNTWLPVEVVDFELRKKIGGTSVRGPEAVKHGRDKQLLAVKRHPVTGALYLADHGRAAAESRISEYVAELLAYGPGDWPTISTDDGTTDEQVGQLTLATAGHIGLFIGTPGSGKTFSLSRMAAKIIDHFGADNLALCAPTNMAAIRMRDGLAGHGIEHPASSIHSLLKVAQAGGADGWKFTHGRENPLPHRFIITDEVSMGDIPIMCSLLSAISPASHILLVGDPNQLPPVGHGAPLRDFIRSKLIPCGELRKIHRNSGTIVKACAAIRDGKPFLADKTIDLECSPPKNLKFIHAMTAEAQIAGVLRVMEAARKEGRNPIWDVQVIVPVNGKSAVSRKEMNKVLQAALNKSGVRVGSNPFAPGDKIVKLVRSVMCPVVGKEKEKDGSEKYFVANGEQAEVVEVKENLTIAKIGNPPVLIKIPRGGKKAADGDEGADGEGGGGGSGDEGAADDEEEKTNTGCQWDLAYAISFHKSQGGGWPIVVLVADTYPGAMRLYSRELWYTGMSRAKVLCVIAGQETTVRQACRRQALDKRVTFLTEKIGEEVEKRKDVAGVKEAVNQGEDVESESLAEPVILPFRFESQEQIA